MKLHIKARKICMAAAAVLASTAALAAGPTNIDFSNGMEGWVGDSAAVGGYYGIDPSMGNGSLGFHSVGLGFGYVLSNRSNAMLLGDYTGMKGFTFSMDVSVNKIGQGFDMEQPISKQLVLELRDWDKPTSQMAFSSVWVVLGTIGAGVPADQHLSVTVADTSSALVPSGWHGNGEFGGWGETVLPPGQTFNRILRDVDEVVISTYIPGWFEGAESKFDLTVDNIAISAVPEPSHWGMMAAGLGVLGLTSRRRKAQRLG